ncbi:hypothetical protein HDU98_006629 [Podochytrium sp. JEL0797]|nr:hypothetical protein HDU98_006629 [Podochytrium sp. JEL0797]
MDLKSSWYHHFSHPNASLAVKWWNIIETAYSEPQRRYHTFTHITSIWSLFTSTPNAHSPVVTLLATCFHDLIYDPMSSTNESDSADTFARFVSEAGSLVSPGDALLVHQLIMSTVKHEPSPMDSETCRFFLDLDLSVLGQEWEVYETYSAGIRFEYACFGDKEFREGRLKVLQRFLGRRELYYSVELKESFEKKARENIEKEIGLLLASNH